MTSESDQNVNNIDWQAVLNAKATELAAAVIVGIGFAFLLGVLDYSYYGYRKLHFGENWFLALIGLIWIARIGIRMVAKTLRDQMKNPSDEL